MGDVLSGNAFSPRKSLPHLASLSLFNRPIILFVTVCTANRRAFLANEAAHNLIRQSWSRADRWSVGRYVIMPDHIHFFCRPHDSEAIFKKWMQFWRNDVTRHWTDESPKPLWQRDYFDRQLRQGEQYHQKWEYVRNNPVRAGFVSAPEEWLFQGEMNVLEW
jgi:REP element-mobilizing transposase RayT